jgi:hypothetical protein
MGRQLPVPFAVWLAPILFGNDAEGFLGTPKVFTEILFASAVSSISVLSTGPFTGDR